MSKPKVSVVIPIYNVEHYIERCVRSLFEQTLDNIEYLFINDCTPDKSIIILKCVLLEFPQRVNQVRIINQPINMGAAKAREVGIKASTGEYIIHCDSDDWVEPSAYQRMYECAKENDYDIVVGDYCEHNGTNAMHLIHQSFGIDFVKTVISSPVMCSLWNKLVKLSLITNNEIYYPKYHMQEDSVLCIQMFYYAKKIGYLNNKKPVYYYFINISSVSHKSGENAVIKRWNEAYANTKLICEFAKKKGFYRQYENAFFLLQANVRGFLMPLLKQSNHYYAEWFFCFSKLNVRYFWLSQVSISLKTVFLLTLLGLYPSFSKTIINIKKL